VAKLENRLGRLHDRRRVHYGRRSPASVAQATAATAHALNGASSAMTQTAVLEAPKEYAESTGTPEVPEQRWDDGFTDREPGKIVREKEHPAKPMTVDQALY